MPSVFCVASLLTEDELLMAEVNNAPFCLTQIEQINCVSATSSQPFKAIAH